MQVLLFDVRLPSITYAPRQLQKPFVGICSPFYNKVDSQVLLVNE